MYGLLGAYSVRRKKVSPPEDLAERALTRTNRPPKKRSDAAENAKGLLSVLSVGLCVAKG